MAITVDVRPKIDVEGFTTGIKLAIAKSLLLAAFDNIPRGSSVGDTIWKAIAEIDAMTEDSE